MKCFNCGAENMDDARFCINCGVDLRKPKNEIDQTILQTKRCPNCGFNNPEEAIFCINCGERLEEEIKLEEKPCPNCGFINPSEAKYCAKCGAKLTEENGGISNAEILTASGLHMGNDPKKDEKDIEKEKENYIHISKTQNTKFNIEKDAFKKVGEIMGNEIIFYKYDNPGEYYKFPKDFVGSVIYDEGLKDIKVKIPTRRFDLTQILGVLFGGLILIVLLAEIADFLGFIVGTIITGLIIWYGLQKVPRENAKTVKTVYLKVILRGRYEPLILEYPPNLENEVKNFARIANLWLVRK